MNKYKILAVLIVVVYFCQSFFLSYGGIGADSLSYFGIASDLPALKTNLFPLGFPFLVKIFYSIFQDYFWATKFLTLIMIVGILLFSWFNQFYFKETVLLFCGKTLFFVFVNIGSEGPFIFLLYFLFYFLNQIFSKKKYNTFNIFAASIIIILMFTVRYSAIYIMGGMGFYWVFQILTGKRFNDFKDIFAILILSGLGIFGYLGFNYFTYGSFTGENLRGKPEAYYPVYIFRDLMGTINISNPFIGIKPLSNGFISLAFQFCLMIADVFIFRYFFKLIKAKRHVLDLKFHYLIWTIAGVYAISLLISGYFQQIEEMGPRLLAASNFLLFFSFLIMHFTNLKSDKYIFRMCCFFFAFLLIYNLKMPVNYLMSRSIIAEQMPKFNHKKYLFNDERGKLNPTIYKIPIIKYTFKYNHTNAQEGELKQSIAGSINPKIKWLKYDTIKEKSQILYTSQLYLTR